MRERIDLQAGKVDATLLRQKYSRRIENKFSCKMGYMMHRMNQIQNFEVLVETQSFKQCIKVKLDEGLLFTKA